MLHNQRGRKMKRFKAYLLSGILVITSLNTTTLMAKVATTAQLPNVGETIYGFKTVETGNFDLINAKTVVFEHEKTGAQLIYIQNQDTDRAFEIAFKTPATDDTGVNHILEHITCSGSEKYPFKNLLFTIANQTYSTNVNAFTSRTMTAYPVSSMSETQLLKLADVYMDCAFNPIAYDDPNLFKREAWRYEKADDNTPLSITGTVYSEMQGTMGNIGTMALYNTMDTLYDGSRIANNSGGDPTVIPTLTYEELLKVHSTYYHPSNAVMILYGDLDYTKFLKQFNEVLDDYERKEISVDYEIDKVNEGFVEKRFDFPVAKEASSKNSAILDYAWRVDSTSSKEDIGMSVLVAYLNNDSSAFQKAFKESGIGSSISIGYDVSCEQPMLFFQVSNVDENKKDSFKQFVDKQMEALIAEKLDSKLLESIMASVEFSNALITEQSNLGFSLATSIGSLWTIDKEDYYFNFNTYFNEIASEAKDGYLEDLAKKNIIDNPNRVLVSTVPKPGLLEDNQVAQAEKLKIVEQNMTKEEMQAIIEETQNFKEWNEQDVNQEQVKSIQAVTVDELPVEVKDYQIQETKEDGVRYLSTGANVGETIAMDLIFNTSAVPVESLHYLNLYTDLVGKLKTSKYSVEELNLLQTTYLSNWGIGVGTLKTLDNGNDFTPTLGISWIGLMDSNEQAISLIEEMLFNTDFDDSEALLKEVQEIKSDFKQSYNQYPLSIVMEYNEASWNRANAYDNYICQLEYYYFLDELEGILKDNPKEVSENLRKVAQLALNKNDLIVGYVGNSTKLETLKAQIQSLIKVLPSESIEKADYSQLQQYDNVGIKIDSTMNYNMLGASYEDLGVELNGKYIPILSIIGENYILPQIRYQNNAYSTLEEAGTYGMYFISYMDPYIEETLEVYKGIDEFIEGYDLTQEVLDRYILKAYSSYTMNQGELSGALSAISNELVGYTTEYKLNLLNQIKNTNVEDFKAFAEVIKKLEEKGTFTSAGNSHTLNEHQDLYDEMIGLEKENKEQVEEAVAVTKEQLIEVLIGSGCWDTAVSYQIISGEKEEAVDFETLYITLYKILAMSGLDSALPTGEEIQLANEAYFSELGQKVIKSFIAAQIIAGEEVEAVTSDTIITREQVTNALNATNQYILQLQQAS